MPMENVYITKRKIDYVLILTMLLSIVFAVALSTVLLKISWIALAGYCILCIIMVACMCRKAPLVDETEENEKI